MISTGFAQLEEVRLEYLEAGSGPLVVLLHGFPECAHCWRHQLTALAEAGFHAVAPNLRGYGHSDKPAGVAAYSADRVALDVVQLVGQLGASTAHVVGHDWGGTVAWTLAMNHPGVLDRLVIAHSPHPENMLAALRTWRQLRKSWYMGFFQLPWLPERLLGARNQRALVDSLRRDHPDAFPEAELAPYREGWSQPYALTAMLNYYRALLRRTPSQAEAAIRRVDAPTLVIWGTPDPFLGTELAVPGLDLLPDQRLELVEGAGHFVQSTAPEQVSALLARFLAPEPAAA
jgi:pimeloyl-ACP methyl ester carboxylesterase